MATKLVLKNTVNNGIIIAGTNVYDMTIGDPSSADTSVTNTTASGTEIQLTKTAGGNVIQWVSGRVPAGGFTLTSTDISINALENNMSANVGGRYRVYKWAGATGVITELGGGPFDDGVEWGTTVGVFTWVGNVTDTALAEDDRILLRIFLTNVGVMASGFTGTLQFNGAGGGASESFLNLTENVTFKTEQRRYWVGGTASWDATVGTKWSAWSGGTGGSPVPTSTDDTLLNATSGAVTVTIATTKGICAGLDCTGFTGTLTGSQDLDCFGSFKLAAGMTYSLTGLVSLKGTSSFTVTTASKSLKNVNCDGVGGTWTLQDDLSIASGSTLTLTNGTFDANNKNVTTDAFVSNFNNTRTLTMGSGLWTIAGPGVVWDCGGTSQTINANTSEIKFTNSSATDKTFAGNGKTYNNFTNDTGSTGKVDITGSNTFNAFDIAKTNNSRTVRFTAATTTTVTNLKRTAGTGHTLTSITAANHALVSAYPNSNSLNETTISRSDASGGANWLAYTSNNNVDGGNNTGWIFDASSIAVDPAHQQGNIDFRNIAPRMIGY